MPLNEGIITFARVKELEDLPVVGKFDTAHLREIHRLGAPKIATRPPVRNSNPGICNASPFFSTIPRMGRRAEAVTPERPSPAMEVMARITSGGDDLSPMARVRLPRGVFAGSGHRGIVSKPRIVDLEFARQNLNPLNIAFEQLAAFMNGRGLLKPDRGGGQLGLEPFRFIR